MGALRETNLGETTRGDGRFALSVRDESSQLLDANVLEKHVRRKVTFHVRTKNNKITHHMIIILIVSAEMPGRSWTVMPYVPYFEVVRE